MPRLPRPTRAFIVLTGAQAMSSGSSLVAVITTSMTLGVHERGLASFVLTSASVLSVIATFGLYIPASTFPELRDRPVSRDSLVAIAFTIFILTLVLIVVSYAGLGLLSPATAFATSGVLTGATVVTFCQRILQARVSSGLYLLFSALNSAVLLVASLATFVSPAWTTFALVFAVGQLLVAGAAAFLLHARLGIGPSPATISGVRHTLRRALPLAIGLIGQILLWRGDSLALGLTTTDASQVAIYSIAAAGTSLVWLPVEALSLLLYRDFARDMSDAERTRVARRLAGWSLVVSLLVGLVVQLMLMLVVHSVLPAYNGATVLFEILLVGVVPASAARILFSAATAVRDARVLYTFSALSFGSFVLYLPATHYFQARGAAVASMVMYLATAAMLVRVLPIRTPAPVA